MPLVLKGHSPVYIFKTYRSDLLRTWSLTLLTPDPGNGPT